MSNSEENLFNKTSDKSLVKDYPLLYNVLRKISTSLSQTLGPTCEVNIHDLRNPASSIVHIDNGHVTGRVEGDAIMDMTAILSNDRFDDDMLYNYTKKTTDGKVLKCFSILIRNDQGEIIGSFGMNFDLGKLLNAKTVIDEFTRGYELNSVSEDRPLVNESVVSILHQIIYNTIEEYGIAVSEMSKEDKIEIVHFLEEKQVFLIKGAINYVAETLNVSRFTIYNYLDEIRSRKNMK
ncbi:PAS domain-containing protein [Oceanobacillus sp. FSL K6-2867]|uniref:helix-turn-helix transcriptional regulator n=1 Tax=Oceanobacillus sp. FSL K6-2867 TaxID=2954748 RepID=UPI0030D98DF0